MRSLIEFEYPFCPVAEAGTCVEAADRVAILQPDLLLLDFAVPDFPGPGALRALAASVRVALLVDDDDSADHTVVRNLGVGAIVDKQSRAAAFLDAIRSVLIGGSPASVSDQRQSWRSASWPSAPRCAFSLTRRERQVLAEVAAAYPNKEIARRLDISEDTVKRHVNALSGKLGVSNRVELTLLATRGGFFPDSFPARHPTRPGPSRLAVRRSGMAASHVIQRSLSLEIAVSYLSSPVTVRRRPDRPRARG
ncbi:MAG: LuxR C-terminal-related transcriptional regulator [Vicinamibacterales bacterium]